MAWQWVAGIFYRNKFNRYDRRALVQHLKVRMLPVGAWLAPQNRRGLKGQSLALCINTLAVAFHFKLLQIGGQAAQGVAVGGDAAAGKAVKVAVPNVQQAKPYG